MPTLGDRLKELRDEKGLTQVDFAKLLNTANSTISQYESNKRSPDKGTIERLSNFFNCSVDYLLGRSDIRETPEQQIESAISDDAELSEFWKELSQREDLQLLFKQVKPLSPKSIKKIMRVIKAIEDEEAMEDL